MTILYADLETFSPIEIKFGAHRYSDAAEILLFPYAIDDGEPQCWDVTTGEPMPDELAAALQDQNVLTVWHNGGMFDLTVLNKVRPGGYGLPHSRVYDTMVGAYSHGLPGSLDTLCAVLGVEAAKSKLKTGKQLINLFCKPRPKNMKLRRATRETHPAEWQAFIEYAIGDIHAMREVYKKLPKWNYNSPIGQDPEKYRGSTAEREYNLWLLDQQINVRGVAVDIELATAAVAAADVARERLADASVELTEGAVASTTKRAALLDHVFEQYGIPLDNLQASTIERKLDDPDVPETLKELLRVRLQATSTSVKKYETLVNATNADGRLRGLLQFNGAARTGRWSGRIFQPQNLPRPSMKQRDIDFAIETIKSGGVELFYANVMDVLTNGIRGCIVAPAGRKLVVADLSNIEGRMAAWLAGESWKVKYFHDYDAGLIEHDNYVMAYAKSFGVDPSVVAENKKHGDGTMRQIGKVQELMLQYQGRVGAFVTGAATYRIDLEDLARAVKSNVPSEVWEKSKGFLGWTLKMKRSTYVLSDDAFIACDCLTSLWREAHPALSSFWDELQEGWIDAVRNPGRMFDVRGLKFRKDGAWLRVRLPSGRNLCYPSARVEEDGSLSYMGVNQYTRKWQRQATYGGSILENCIAEGTLVLTARGWVAIENVAPTDAVWDGEEWVAHSGAVYKGKQFVTQAFSVTMTPDHLVLTEGGWKSASSSEGHNRAACRLPDGYQVPRRRRDEVSVGGALRLREAGNHRGDRAAKEVKEGHHLVLRVHDTSHVEREEYKTRDVRASGVLGLAIDGGPLPVDYAQSVAAIWGAWYFCMRRMGEGLQQLLERYGALVQGWLHSGKIRQRGPVLPGELCVEDVQSTGEQYAPHDIPGHTSRQDALQRSSSLLRGGEHHTSVPAGAWVAAGRSVDTTSGLPQSAVYDILNCGPRSRFVVLGDDGGLLIVHNCTQAASRDVMAHTMPLVEAAGFNIVLTVHDELITEAPDSEEYNADRLGALLATVPEWAPGLPLAAAGFEAYRYRKE